MSEIPSIETGRLLLRPFSAADVDAYAAIRFDPQVARWLPPAQEGEAERDAAARLIEHFRATWAAHGVGPWAVCDRERGTLLGHCGLRYLAEFDGVEALWSLAPAAWGRGLATEAAAASLDFGFGPAGLERIFAITLPENRASRGVMERLGMGYRRQATYKGIATVYYDIDRGAWNARRAP